jgi:ABC-type transport system involved in cytochrome c biogenesis ATPase subunit
VTTVADTYRQLLVDLQAGIAQARSVQTETVWLLAAALLFLSALSYLALNGRVPIWSPPLPAPAAMLLARRYGKNRSSWSRLSRLRNFYERGLERIENRFAGRGFSGEEFLTPDHPYASDLNLFGTGSLFELLCTTRTQIGRQRLADYLLDTPELSEARARQESVQELSGQTRLREKTALLGKFDFRGSSGKTFTEWLSATAVLSVAPWPIRALALACSVLSVGLMAWTYFAMPIALASLMKTGPWIAVLLVVNAGIAALFRRRANGPLDATKQVSPEIGVLREGIELLQKERFEAAKLRTIQQELTRDDAARALRRIERITKLLDLCDHPFFELFAHLLAVRTQLWFAIERWRFCHGESLKGWMHAWAEFEALAAVAGYAYENPANRYPTFLECEPLLDARALGHPTIPDATCVRNDVLLGKEDRFYIVSGSNMAGKSTLLRAIGLNLALAGTGAPVRAQALSVSRLTVCASIGIADSLREGKSKFLAEIAKLRQMIDRKSTLFLIDEILAGTNSKDRRTVAEEFVTTLVRNGAVGLLSTHDLALTEIADVQELKGCNVHMASPDPSRPLDFDYVLKPGVIQESNALAIAAMAGVVRTDRMEV